MHLPPDSTPVPVSETVCGLLFALSVTESVRSRVPVVEGVKVTLIVQLAFAAKVEPQSSVSAKLALTPILAMSSVPLPLLLNVTDWAGLVVPTSSPTKVKLVGDKVALGGELTALTVTNAANKAMTLIDAAVFMSASIAFSHRRKIPTLAGPAPAAA